MVRSSVTASARSTAFWPPIAGQRQDGDGVLADDGAALLAMRKPEPERAGERDRGRPAASSGNDWFARQVGGRVVQRRSVFDDPGRFIGLRRLDRGGVEQVATPRNGLDQALAVVPEARPEAR